MCYNPGSDSLSWYLIRYSNTDRLSTVICYTNTTAVTTPFSDIVLDKVLLIMEDIVSFAQLKFYNFVKPFQLILRD